MTTTERKKRKKEREKRRKKNMECAQTHTHTKNKSPIKEKITASPQNKTQRRKERKVSKTHFLNTEVLADSERMHKKEEGSEG